MELITLRSDAELPLYLQLYEGIKKQILQGLLKPQEKLPSKRWWMDEYNLSQNTVENTLFLLQEEGYIISKPRKGYYVAELTNLQSLYSSYVLHSESSMETEADSKANTGFGTSMDTEENTRFATNVDTREKINADIRAKTNTDASANTNVDTNASATIDTSNKQEATETAILYDFTYSGIDTAHMPTQLFKRITRDVYDELDDELAFQGEVQGYAPLRQSICNYLRQSRGFYARPEQIVISAGTEYLFHIIFKLLPHKVFGLENPGYHLLHQLFETGDVAYKPISLDESGICIEDLDRNGVDVACITPSHQFPTGVIMPLNRRSQLLHWAEEQEGRFIIEDDYDSEFKYQGRPLPALKALDRQGKIIYLGSFSKSISPAIRMSYMVLPDTLVTKYRERVPYFGCPVGTVSQKILNRFIGEAHFEKHLNRMRTLYKKKRGLLVQTLQRESEQALKQPVVVRGADAGLHLVITFPEGLNEAEFMAQCKQSGINIDPLRHYYMKLANSRDTMSAINSTETMSTENPANLRTSKINNERSYLLGYGSLTIEELEAGVKVLMQCAKAAYESD